MRQDLKNPYTHLLKYGIREIVLVVDELKNLDPSFSFVSENIGDPVAKGWAPPAFMKEIIKKYLEGRDLVFGYVHSRGLLSAREWVVEESKKYNPESFLAVNDVLFTNGLGSAISSLIYRMLPKGVRVIGPTPSYPTHISAESFASQEEQISYETDPAAGWQPDLENLEAQIKKNPKITGVLVINPNNPTGAVYARKILEKIVGLAEKYKLFIISDEVYFRMVYNNREHIHLVRLAHNRVPLLVMRGSSKDLPWPGGRSGWLEFHNRHLDEEFNEFAKAISQAVLMEVCATSLPQYVLPEIYNHPEFPGYLSANNKKLEENGNYITQVLNSTAGLGSNRPDGAFYIMARFENGALNNQQILPIRNKKAKEYIESLVSAPNFPLDKRFAYYLLASTGICVVPATDFYTKYLGFRVTTLERDPVKLKDTYSRLKSATQEYLAST